MSWWWWLSSLPYARTAVPFAHYLRDRTQADPVQQAAVGRWCPGLFPLVAGDPPIVCRRHGGAAVLGLGSPAVERHQCQRKHAHGRQPPVRLLRRFARREGRLAHVVVRSLRTDTQQSHFRASWCPKQPVGQTQAPLGHHARRREPMRPRAPHPVLSLKIHQGSLSPNWTTF